MRSLIFYRAQLHHVTVSLIFCSCRHSHFDECKETVQGDDSDC